MKNLMSRFLKKTKSFKMWHHLEHQKDKNKTYKGFLILILALIQVLLIVSLVPSSSYQIEQTNSLFSGGQAESYGIKVLRNVLISWLSKGLVSAQTDQGFATCLVDNKGANCQEYVASECDANCQEGCFPGRREDFFECNLGTCIDESKGTCDASSPRATCESSGGKWDERAKTEIPECNPGCCLLDGQSNYVTENACNFLEQTLGVSAEFQQVNNEIECLVLGDSDVKGACVLEEVPGVGKNNCEFITQSSCLSSGGEFHEGVLCSNEELNTICEKQETTGCSEDGNEVYWIDSCGNRENIYDTNKIKSYNNGRVLSKEESCSLASGGDDFGNQASCGNCRVFDSVCGLPGARDVSPVQGEFVCKSLNCVDENGEERSNGESWCAFNSRIGVDGEDRTDSERSVDVPGSRHFRQVCSDGEIRTDACADFRNEVCQEDVDESSGFSSAACRLNPWQQCIDANTDKTKLNNCEENSACFLKRVDVDKNFKFDVCVPKYPEGFDLKADLGGEVGETICQLASQTCTYIEVKKPFSGWKCQVNCDCKTAEFTQDLNNLCTSLGDCGASVNVHGDFSDEGIGGNNRLRALTPDYIKGLKEYSTPKEGQKVDPLSDKELAAIFGLTPGELKSPSGIASTIGTIAGIGGIALKFAAGSSKGAILLNKLNLGKLVSKARPELTGQGPGLSASGGALAGAAIGASVVSFAISFLGLENAFPPAAQLALIIGGAYVGAYVGASLTGQAFGNQFLAAFFNPVAALVIAIVIVVILVLGKLLGWGKTRKREVAFSCLPWQPPTGGNACGSCGEDGLGCSKYQCQSLGQNCEIVNSNTDEEACININPDDVSAPIISPLKDVVTEGFSYENINNNGFTIKGPTADGCIPAFTKLDYGVQLSERGQCKVEAERTSSYEDMSAFFSGSNLYKQNHTTSLVLPSLESLGEGFLKPDARVDFNLYLRCQDPSGNSNVQEYAINFCLSPERDITPPILKNFKPESPAFTSVEGTEKEISFFTNEPAECRWSLEDKDYKDMENEVECGNDFEEVSIRGWACNVTLPVSQEENNYYFRCKDQPWLDDVPPELVDGRTRNINSESVSYEIKRSKDALEIVSVSPEGLVKTAGLPSVIDLDVVTKGGVEELPRYCEFDLGNGFVRFFDSGTNNHKQKNLNFWIEKDYDIPIRCEDGAGNIAEDNIKFNLEVDDTGPLITRVYRQSGVTVVTDEVSQCTYSLNTCNFNFDNGTLMSGRNLVHTTSFDDGFSYHTKCQDDFGNIGECLIISGGLF